MYKTIKVQFVGQGKEYNLKEYNYLTDLDLKQRDLVVVDTVYGYKTATVCNLFGEKTTTTKWVVCKVDIEAFAVKLEELKRKQFIMNQMTQRMESVNQIAQFELVAKSDPEMAKLLEAFKTDLKDIKELAE